MLVLEGSPPKKKNTNHLLNLPGVRCGQGISTLIEDLSFCEFIQIVHPELRSMANIGGPKLHLCTSKNETKRTHHSVASDGSFGFFSG